MHGTPFADRTAAGRELGLRLARMQLRDPVVLGLARGGVVVAAEVARLLRADLDVMVVRKLGHPRRPEMGLGALAEDGDPVYDETGLARALLSHGDLAEVAATERAECKRRVELYRADRPATDVFGRTVVLVDDGIATGVSARAALRWLRTRGPARLVLASPVASRAALDRLRTEADEIVTLQVPDRFGAVSSWYRQFDQTPDEVVSQLLVATPRRSR
jgi:predicted phosphoribosyltransferase